MITNPGLIRGTNKIVATGGLTTDVSGRFPGGEATFTRASSQYTTINGVVTTAANNVPLFPAGILLEPSGTNKCTCYGVPRADAYGSTLNSGTATKGKAYEIVTRTSVNWDAVGTLLSGTSNTVGAQYLITGSLTFTADDTGKEVIDRIGTKAYYDTAFNNPITSMTLSGDTSAVLSIVDDTAELTNSGLLGLTNGGKVYKLVTGATTAQVGVGGAMTAVITSISVYMAVTAGTGTLSDSAGANAVTSTATAYTKKKVENFTATATRTLRISGAANTTLYFILPQLEENPYTSTLIPSVGASTPRATTSLSYPVTGNFPSSGIRHISFNWTPQYAGLYAPSGHQLPVYLWSTRVNASNYTAIWYNGTILAFEKRVGGVSEFAVYPLTAVVGTTYRIDGLINADNTLTIKVNGVAGASGMGSEIITHPIDITQVSPWAWSCDGTKTSSTVATATGTSIAIGAQAPATPFTRGKAYSFYASATRTGTGVLGVYQAGALSYVSFGQLSVFNSGVVTQASPGLFLRLISATAGDTITISEFSVKEIYNNTTTTAPQIGSTMEIGSLNGVSNAYANFSSFAIAKK